MISVRKLNETNISLFPVAIFISIVGVLMVGAVFHIRELNKQSYFTELRAASDNGFVDIRQAKREKER